MIEIINNQGNTIHYSCSCGVKGKCMIKPLSSDAALVVNLECPMCFQVERLTLIQYTDDKSKDKLISTLNEKEMTWAIILSNEVIK